MKNMQGNISIVLFIFTHVLFGQFQHQNSQTTNNLNDVVFLDVNIGIAVGNNGTIIRTIDGGENWNLIMEDNSIVFQKINFFDNQNCIAIGSHIYISNNAGETWSNIAHSNTTFYDIALLNGTTCLISGEPATLIKSTNYGQSFSNIIEKDANNNLRLLSFIDENIGFSCKSTQGGLTPTLKTIDGGLSWTLLPDLVGTYTIMEAFTFISELKGFKGGWYEPYFKQTSDSAIQWNFVTTNETISPSLYDFHIKSTQPNAYFACGWYGEIYKSIDGGDNWFILNSGVANDISIRGIFFVNDNKGWAVGDGGTVIKTENGGVLSTDFNNTDATFVELYPNPAHTKVNIKKSKNTVIDKIVMFTSTGQMINSLKFDNSIDISTLAKGIYFIKFESADVIQFEKLIIN